MESLCQEGDSLFHDTPTTTDRITSPPPTKSSTHPPLLLPPLFSLLYLWLCPLMWKNPSYGPVDLEIEYLQGSDWNKAHSLRAHLQGYWGQWVPACGSRRSPMAIFCARYWDPVLRQHFPMAEGPSGLQAPMPAAPGDMLKNTTPS